MDFKQTCRNRKGRIFMAIEKAVEFLQEMRADDSFREKLKDLKAQTEEKILEAYAETAKKTGLDLTIEELKEAAQSLGKQIEQSTDAAAEDIRKLDDEDLENVAGGALWRGDDSEIDGHELFCILTYHGAEWSLENNEWCHSNYMTEAQYWEVKNRKK